MMYTLSINVWFQKLIRQFFFAIDKITFNFISTMYDLLLGIARTSVITQADVLDMASRIYKFLALFMIFKVTFSLITYVINPNDFSDQNKGLSKLGTNIIISLSLLILTPYLFRYAYQIQTIILEDNSLAILIFGEDKYNDDKNFINSAGDDMAYITLSAFYNPDTSIDGLEECTSLLVKDSNDSLTINEACFGLDEAAMNEAATTDPEKISSETGLFGIAKKSDTLTNIDVVNYANGLLLNSMGLMFRQNLAVATDTDGNFIMDYKYIFSTITGVIVILILITFCMDVGLRSIKLAFYQLIAPIPILSYIDPKGGKDGMFKKWYEACFKTFLSLFIRLLALYFAVYIISRIHGLTDIITGAKQTSFFIYVFIIIGALMFAKDFPKILEGLGIKLDGGGKFFLNPFKKFEEQALGGKRITGMAGGMAAGLIGGHGVAGRLGSMFGGAARGFLGNKGYKGGLERQADVNRKLREARINGAGFFGSRAAVLSSRYGLDDVALERDATKLRKDKRRIELAKRERDGRIKAQENTKKEIQDRIQPDMDRAKGKKLISDKGKALVDFAKTEITGGKAGVISNKANLMHARQKYLAENVNKVYHGEGQKYYTKEVNEEGKEYIKENLLIDGMTITDEMASKAQGAVGLYEGKIGAMEHLEVRLQGAKGFRAKVKADGSDYERDETGKIIFEAMNDTDRTSYEAAHGDFSSTYNDYASSAEAYGENVEISASTIKTQSDVLSSEARNIESSHARENKQIADIDVEISQIRETSTVEYDGEQVTIDEAERRASEEEQRQKDISDRNKLNRQTAQNRSFFNSSK